MSCEHGGARIPARYRRHFRHAARALRGHRGYDAGALPLARALARALDAPLVATTVSRLLIDCNRSLHHPHVLSRWARRLGPAERARLLRHYRAHRARVQRAIRDFPPGLVVHVAVHTFTPRLRGETRRTDIGLLYDPGRPRERAYCEAWTDALRAAVGVRVRRNYPYRGAADGLTTALRTRFPARRYLGIEVEINQRLLAGLARFPPWVGPALWMTMP